MRPKKTPTEITSADLNLHFFILNDFASIILPSIILRSNDCALGNLFPAHGEHR